jgi:hypothetical protein
MAKHEVTYGRTPLGQAVYDIYFSSLSAVEVARRHKLDRAYVLEQRKHNPVAKAATKKRKP